jgi:hypothetical protein
MASRLRSILSPPKSLSPVALSDAPKENQRPRTTLPTPPQTPGLNRAFVQGVASPEALLVSTVSLAVNQLLTRVVVVEGPGTGERGPR